jgi:transposase
MKKYEVELTKEEQALLRKLVSKGKESARKIKRANVLLLANEGKKDQEICEILNTSTGTTERTRKKFVLEGLEVALRERARPGAPMKVDGRVEAQIIAKACSSPPEGRSEWSLRLLTSHLVELDISYGTVHNTLKKMKLSLG